MAWQDFREQYRNLQLKTLRAKTAIDSESRLDIAERILQPTKLKDVASADALHRLQASLLAGHDSRNDRPRSPFTVKTYMSAVIASLNWAHLQGWLPVVPRIRKIKVAKLRAMRGRPLTDDEFRQMLEAASNVVPADELTAWQHLLNGLWESGLRLDELLNVSWDDVNQIHPKWEQESLPVLRIPSTMQKNNTEEEIPLLPEFERLLLNTPVDSRHGFIFGPYWHGADGMPHRYGLDHVGKVISKIGRKAAIVVHPGDPTTGRPAKYASAHDLRRSCAQRLERAGVPPTIIGRILRHSSWETTRKHYVRGEVQEDALVLANRLGKTDNDSQPSSEKK